MSTRGTYKIRETSHLAIWEDDSTTWGDLVTEEEYNAYSNGEVGVIRLGKAT